LIANRALLEVNHCFELALIQKTLALRRTTEKTATRPHAMSPEEMHDRLSVARLLVNNNMLSSGEKMRWASSIMFEQLYPI